MAVYFTLTLPTYIEYHTLYQPHKCSFKGGRTPGGPNLKIRSVNACKTHQINKLSYLFSSAVSSLSFAALSAQPIEHFYSCKHLFAITHAIELDSQSLFSSSVSLSLSKDSDTSTIQINNFSYITARNFPVW